MGLNNMNVWLYECLVMVDRVSKMTAYYSKKNVFQDQLEYIKFTLKKLLLKVYSM